MPKIVRSLDYKNTPRLSSYREGAAKRGLPFLLSQSDFDTLIGQSCHYCGHTGPNGIDRKDNDVGYLMENCVPACLQCNYAKGSHRYDNFVSYLRRAGLHQARLTCLHAHLVTQLCDQAVSAIEVLCLDCDMSAICWADEGDEHIPETLWNCLAQQDKNYNPCKQNRENYCAVCKSEIVPRTSTSTNTLKSAP